MYETKLIKQEAFIYFSSAFFSLTFYLDAAFITRENCILLYFCSKKLQNIIFIVFLFFCFYWKNDTQALFLQFNKPKNFIETTLQSFSLFQREGINNKCLPVVYMYLLKCIPMLLKNYCTILPRLYIVCMYTLMVQQRMHLCHFISLFQDDTRIMKVGDKKKWIHDPNSE